MVLCFRRFCSEVLVRILHSSDLHGSYKPLLAALAKQDYDVWIDTGDFFPNKTRGILPEETQYQSRWFRNKMLSPRLTDALAGKPMISIGGNHDFVRLAPLLKQSGAVAHDLSDGFIDLDGLRFAGFRQIPWIAGEWNGEEHDLRPHVEKALATDPDILVTHAPPDGILDDFGYGIECLTSSLMYSPHRVQAHLFGHAHLRAGESREVGGVTFHNSATCVRIIVV